MSKTISVYLLVPAVSWLVAQTAKAIWELRGTKPDTPRKFFRSGSMPSAHSALIVALLTVIGAKDGVDSGLFGAVAVVASIILYDAVNVRRAVGEQGKALQSVTKTKFFSAEGHRLPDVIVGSAIGLVVALLMLQILQRY